MSAGPVRPGVADTDHREALRSILRGGGITLEQLWAEYFALGGDAGLIEIEAYLQALMPLGDLQRDIIAHAANEHLDELTGRLRVPYSHPIRERLPDSGPLAALVQLMRDTPQALSGDLAAVASTAARALGPGIDIAVYLINYEQDELKPYVGPAQSGSRNLSVEGTVAGRAFVTGVVQSTQASDARRLYVPLIDGMERLGVLDITVTHPGELSDPLLRQQAGWLASLLAHLVSQAASSGDAVDAVRRSADRTTSAELIWALLPPITAGNAQFTVSGLIEPAATVGGDIFDYALAVDRVSFSIFDAMGHSLRSGLIAATALTAARAARRAGLDLLDQAAAIDAALEENFPDAFATGWMGEIDLRNGRLRYLAAGHPMPFVVRAGKIVGTLDGGRRPPFGLPVGDTVVAEVALQPSDWVALYTDGVTEARDDQGAFFGTQRLTDHLERAAAASAPLPETVRRLIRSVMAHQHGVLQDDATVLLCAWQPPQVLPMDGGSADEPHAD